MSKKAFLPSCHASFPPVPERSHVWFQARQADGYYTISSHLQWVFAELMKLFASQDHPLIIVFDDLHFADLASMKVLMEIQNFTNLLLICSWDNSQISATHPYNVCSIPLLTFLFLPVTVIRVVLWTACMVELLRSVWSFFLTLFVQYSCSALGCIEETQFWNRINI